MLLRSGPLLLMGWLAVPAVAGAVAVVEVEEVVTSCEPANNGAGPLWCYGATVIARQGERVWISVIETGKDVPPLCNTRWQLWTRETGGWKPVQQEDDYRQREPCPIAVFPEGPVFLSVNPSIRPRGTQYGPCRPAVLEFDPARPSSRPIVHEPVWAKGTNFTDHSYRGFAADGGKGELLLLNINAQTGDQFVSWRDAKGTWQQKGTLRFPIRSCYPQVALRDRGAHVMAIGDIVEPVEEWRKLKKEKLHREWDYVFRRLFYAWTPDIAGRPFSEPIEIDTVDRTGGHISNLDLHVDAGGTAHLLYLKRPHQYEFLRDRYFPGERMVSRLEYVTVKDGRIVNRRTLAETPDGGPGLAPAFARFHAGPSERLFAIAAGTFAAKGAKDRSGNFLAEVSPNVEGLLSFEPLDLKHPFSNFMTSTPRAGSVPGDVIDLFGAADDSPRLRYARVRLSRR